MYPLDVVKTRVYVSCDCQLLAWEIYRAHCGMTDNYNKVKELAKKDIMGW